ncbi:YCF48-related protein [Mucilaginibacter sp. CSA2-8R]|uniref:WD40/YVTN/BNR-like repeat-containing protein n=1 Tax=Mucilaginibacter sp. CSA2-8R TaxID=3141542 RepID=UPI00315D3CAC
MRFLSVLLGLMFVVKVISAQSLTIVEKDKATSIRGLSVVNNQVAWVSGSKGHVGISTNGGQTWAWQQVPGFEQSDFRDVEAFSATEAIIMSSGTPAVILKTTDAGKSWKACYRNEDKAYFLDGIDFYDAKHGLIMGDPINGKFLLLETQNGGETWQEVSTAPAAIKEEAAFAASGTSIIINKATRQAIMVTGGPVSRLLISRDLKTWNKQTLPIAQGLNSKGSFSVAQGGGNTVIVGGNYVQNKKVDSVACYSDGKQATSGFKLAKQMPGGFQSGVVYLNKATFLATGTSGTNLSLDGGQGWKLIDSASFNVCQKARQGNLIILAGDKGRIAIFKYQ